MKYLEIDTLNRLNLRLSGVETSDCTRLFGRVEAYSCKPAGEDKKLYKLIEQKYGCETTIIRRLLYTDRPHGTSDSEDFTSTFSAAEDALIKSDFETSPRKRTRTLSENEGGRKVTRVGKGDKSGLSKKVIRKKGQLQENPPAKATSSQRHGASRVNESNEIEDATLSIPMSLYSSSAPESLQLRDGLTTIRMQGLTRTITRTTFDHTPESLQLYYLLGTLQLAEPDFDCSNLHPSQFQRCGDLKSLLGEVKMGALIQEAVWDTLGRNEEELSVFMLRDEGLLDDGVPNLWRKRLFILNKRRKRVVYITLRVVPILQALALESPWQSSTPRSPSLVDESADEQASDMPDPAGRMLAVN